MTTSANRAARNRQLISQELASHGGVCACGCNLTLQLGYHWHHVVPATKVAGIGRLKRATATVLRAELQKCVPMAPTCHLLGQHHH